jgi:hypothetical protein
MLGAEGEQRDRKPRKITVKSVRGRPLDIDMEPVDAVRFLSAFGTTEPDFASLLLSGIIKRGLRGELSTPVLPKRAPSQDRRADSAGSPRGHIEMVDGIYYEFIWFPMKLRIDFGSQGGSPSAHKCSFGSTKKFTLMFPTGTSPDDTSFARV